MQEEIIKVQAYTSVTKLDPKSLSEEANELYIAIKENIEDKNFGAAEELIRNEKDLDVLQELLPDFA